MYPNVPLVTNSWVVAAPGCHLPFVATNILWVFQKSSLDATTHTPVVAIVRIDMPAVSCSTPRALAIAVVLFCVYAIHLLGSQRAFERYLQSSSTTFDDFPSDYSTALIDAQKAGLEFQYDNFSTFPSLDPDATIPPIIHYIWFRDLYSDHLDVSRIPATGSDGPEHCREYNPHFTVNVWNASAARLLIAEHYAWFLPTYDGYHHPIQRVDAFKYFVVWHYGGIYMDMDIDCRRPLYPLTQFTAWFPKTEWLGVNNDAFAASKNHPLIGEMTKRLQGRDWNLLFPYLTIYWSTGPQFASDVIQSWFSDHRGDLSDLTTLESKDAGKSRALVFVYLRAYAERRLHLDPDRLYILPIEFHSEEYRFFRHSAGGTWHGWDVALVLFFVAHPWVFALVVGPLASCCLLICMRWRMRRKRVVYNRVVVMEEDRL